MNYFKEIPYLKLILPVIFGIITASYLKDHILNYSLFLALFCGICLFSLLFWPFIKSVKWSTYLLLFYLFVLGFTRYQAAIPQASQQYYGHQIKASTDQSFLIKIKSTPIIGKNLRAFADVLAIQKEDQLLQVNGEILLYFNFDSIAPAISYGQELLIYTQARPVKSNDNPLAFNYDDYLRNRNVYYQAYIAKEKWQVYREDNTWSIYKLASQLRKYCNNVIDRYVAGSDNKAIASAMLLGLRNNLSDDIYTAYTDTGAVHVLAVSGLHVGIVNSFLVLILFWWRPKSKTQKVLKAGIIIAGIWIFTLVTGAAPAVSRAATMFTLFTFGYIFYRRISIYNILAFSALLLLMIEPKYILQGSFQFSYLALLSIVFFHPIIKEWYSSKYAIRQQLWNLIVVAISAQVLVFPVTIYYFHKFALSFWLSGIFAVLLAYVVIVLGIILFMIAPISGFLSMVIGTILSWTLSIFITCIKVIQAIPYSTMHDLWLDLPQMIMLYIGIFCYMIYYRFRKNGLIIIGLVCLNIVFLMQIRFINATEKAQEIVVYDSNQNLIIDFIQGRERVTIKSVGTPLKNEQFVAANYRLSKSIKEEMEILPSEDIDEHILYKRGPFMKFGEKTIYLHQGKPSNFIESPKVDILVIDQIKHWDVKKLINTLNADKTILTHHMKNWEIRQVRKELDRLGQEYSFVGDKAEIVILNNK